MVRGCYGVGVTGWVLPIRVGRTRNHQYLPGPLIPCLLCNQLNSSEPREIRDRIRPRLLNTPRMMLMAIAPSVQLPVLPVVEPLQCVQGKQTRIDMLVNSCLLIIKFTNLYTKMLINPSVPTCENQGNSPHKNGVGVMATRTNAAIVCKS
jgi:hypothetical protein